MNKILSESIKNILFKYISIIFNVAETSDIMLAVQLFNAENYFYEIVKGLEKIAKLKKMKFYSIDLDYEDFGMNEIDARGNYIVPPWLKNNEHAIILVYNIDSLKRKNYKLKQLRNIIIDGKLEGIPVPAKKHFVLISNKDLKLKPNLMELDIEKAVKIEKERNREIE